MLLLNPPKNAVKTQDRGSKPPERHARECLTAQLTPETSACKFVMATCKATRNARDTLHDRPALPSTSSPISPDRPLNLSHTLITGAGSEYLFPARCSLSTRDAVNFLSLHCCHNVTLLLIAKAQARGGLAGDTAD